MSILRKVFLPRPSNEYENEHTLEEYCSKDTRAREGKATSHLHARYYFFSTSIPYQCSNNSSQAFSSSRESTTPNPNYAKLLNGSFDVLHRIQAHKEWCRVHLPVLMLHRGAVYDQINAQKSSIFLLQEEFADPHFHPNQTKAYEKARQSFFTGEFLASRDGQERCGNTEASVGAGFSPFSSRSSTFLSPLVRSCVVEAGKVLDKSESGAARTTGRTLDTHSATKNMKETKKSSKMGMMMTTTKKKKGADAKGLPLNFRLWARPLVWAPPSPTTRPFSFHYSFPSSRSSSSASSTVFFYDPDMPWGFGVPPTHTALSSSFSKPYSDGQLPLLSSGGGSEADDKMQKGNGEEEEGEGGVTLSASSERHYESGTVGDAGEEDEDELARGTKPELAKKKKRRGLSHSYRGSGSQLPFSFSILPQKGDDKIRESVADGAVDPSQRGAPSSGGSASAFSRTPFSSSSEPLFTIGNFFTGRKPSISSLVSLPTPEILPPGLPSGTVLLAHPCSSSFCNTSRVFLITRRTAVFTTGVLLDAEYLHAISRRHPVFPEVFWGHPIRNGGPQKTRSTMPPTPCITVLHNLGVPSFSSSSSTSKNSKGPREVSAAYHKHAHYCEPLIPPETSNRAEKSSTLFHHHERKSRLRKNFFVKKYLHDDGAVKEEEENHDSSMGDGPALYVSHVESLPYLADLIAEHDRQSHDAQSRNGDLSRVPRRAVHIFWGTHRFYTSQLEEEVQAGQWIPVRVSPGFLYAAATFQPSGFSPTLPIPFPPEDWTPPTSSVSEHEPGRGGKGQGHDRERTRPPLRRNALQNYFPSEKKMKEMRQMEEKEREEVAVMGTGEGGATGHSSATPHSREDKPSSPAWNSFLESRSKPTPLKTASPFVRSTSGDEEGDDEDLDQAELADLLNDDDVLSWSTGLEESGAPHDPKHPVSIWDAILYALGGEYRSLIGFGAKDTTL